MLLLANSTVLLTCFESDGNATDFLTYDAKENYDVQQRTDDSSRFGLWAGEAADSWSVG